MGTDGHRHTLAIGAGTSLPSLPPESGVAGKTPLDFL